MNWPGDQKLLEMVASMPMTQVGKAIGVSDNAVRKRLKKRALKAPPRELWRGTGMLGTEGPHTYKINGRYYLMTGEGGTEYGHAEVLIYHGAHTLGQRLHHPGSL